MSTKQFIRSGALILEERDGAGSLGNGKQFFALGQVGFSSGTPSNHFYTKDHPGSTREVTDGSGAIVAQYAYGPFGEATKLQGGQHADFQYAGYYMHGPSGLNLPVFRAYSSSLGRFINRDPIGESVGANLYGYVGGNPISNSDPLGLWELSIQWRSPFGIDPMFGAHGNLMLSPTGTENFPVQGWGASRHGLKMDIVPKGALENPRYRQKIADDTTSRMCFSEVKDKMDKSAKEVGAMDWDGYMPIDFGTIPAKNSDTALWEMIDRMGLPAPAPMPGVWTPGYGPRQE